MLSLLILRQLDPKTIDGNLRMKESMHKNFKTNPVDYSFVETGQQEIEPDLDERMID